MVNRNYIIDRLKSKTTTAEKFNFDMLSAPPILSIFTMDDLNKLHYIATSLKLSGKPDVKFKEIDKIMESRGFRQFINGTNRVVYRFLEDKSFLCKVAYNSESCKDSLREFYNQNFLKPFVTKIFEVTPDGVLAFCERVTPITSSAEYKSIADDIYVMLNEWFLESGYVFDDMGTEDFMNTGLRNGFGPVILDYPYVYPIDHNKIFCRAPDSLSPTGCCEGEIDYDAGFNQLICTKCGAKYRAKELAKAIKDNKIIIKDQGGIKMKIELSGGKLGDKKIEIEPYDLGVKSTREIGLKVENKPKEKIEKDKSVISKTVQNIDVEVKDERAKNNEPDNPISFDASLIDRKDESLVQKISNIYNLLLNKFDSENDQDKSTIINILLQMIEKITDLITEEGSPTINIEPIVGKLFGITSNLYSLYECQVEDNTPDIEPLHIPIDDLSSTAKINLAKDLISSDFDLTLGVEDGLVEARLYALDDILLPDVEEYYISGDAKSVEEIVKEADYKVEPEIIEPVIEKAEEFLNKNGYDIDRLADYNDISEYSGEIINVKDIFPDKDSKKVMVLIDEDGDYITVGSGDNLLVVNKINDREINKLSIVPKTWYDAKTKETKETKEVPTGVAPKFGVNGIEEE